MKVSLLEGQVTLDTSCRTSLKYLAGLNFIFYIYFWQEWQASNPQPPVLETGALPVELHSFILVLLQRIFYSIISETTPEPTVLPPSRIAKRKLLFIAIGASNSTSSVILSPGITISVPSGNLIEPVTSVVLK